MMIINRIRIAAVLRNLAGSIFPTVSQSKKQAAEQTDRPLMLFLFSLAVFCLSGSAFFPARAGESAAEERYQQVRELNPVGYWPVDEGEGEVAQDRSGNQNHARIYSVPWQDGLLNFENRVYQWIHIPPHRAYESPAFSMGGWVYSRKTYNEKYFGALIMGQPFKPSRGEGTLSWGFWGGKAKVSGPLLRFGSTTSGPNLIEVVQRRQKDVLGSATEDSAGASIELVTGEWQHVIYTYDGAGTGRLYRNGSLVHTAEEVPAPFKEVPHSDPDRMFPWAIGAGRWQTSNTGGIQSLDGSVRDMVLFNRALEENEVKQLCEATRPEKEPASPDTSGEETASSSSKDLDELIAQLRDTDRSRKERAEAALALADMGEEASEAVPALGEVLSRISERLGTHPPRIEEPLRNAAMRALLDIAPDKERVRNLLGKNLARPIFKTLDGSGSYLDDIRPMVKNGRYMDALEALREHFADVPELPKLSDFGADYTEEQLDKLRSVLPLDQEYFDAYLSRGFPFSDAYYNAYTQVDALEDGTTYIPVVERVSWKEVKSQYNKNLERFAEEKPEKDGKWSRLKILEFAPDGSERASYLGGPWLIFNADDIKLDGWSIFVDKAGYIHLTGGQHNQPDRDEWIPGSWDRFGINSADVMYWVSEQPRNITSFEFVGQEDNPRSYGGWMNYMQFVRSPNGTPFLFGRGRMWSWALLRYDVEKQRWTELKGSYDQMMERARRKNPDWFASLGPNVYPYHIPGDGVVAAWQTGGYNLNRQWGGRIRGISFDRTGRMHVRMIVLGIGKEGRITGGPVYAYSDDLGQTFHRADGTRLKLPLTTNPIPGHDANLEHHSSQQWYDLWKSLIREAFP